MQDAPAHLQLIILERTLLDAEERGREASAMAIPALKLAYARGHYCDEPPCPGCEAGYALEAITGRKWTQEEAGR